MAELRVIAFTQRYVEREPGYLPIEKTRKVQQLVFVEPGFFGRSRHVVLDTEIVPEHVLISVGCFGDTGGWKSKFADIPGVKGFG
jgi:hypothetical protein